MEERRGQVGWSEAQWNQVRQAIGEEAARARVAGSFLPIYGPLPRSTQVVPSERMNASTWTVDDISTAPLVELSCNLKISGAQMREDDLGSALLLFRRAASALTRLEDWTIFNGREELFGNKRRTPRTIPRRLRTEGGEQAYRSEEEPLGVLPVDEFDRDHQTTESIAWTANLENRMRIRLLLHNPGALGLVEGGSISVPRASSVPGERVHRELDWRALVDAIVEAVTELESRGHPRPFVCVLSNEAFRVASSPLEESLVLPRDRIEPFLGRELLRSSAIDDRPWELGRSVYRPPAPGGRPTAGTRPAEGPSELVQGVVLSLAGDSMDLAVAVDPIPEFLSIDNDGDYLFRVYERFALRLKQTDAVVRLAFAPPGTPGPSVAQGESA